MRATTLRRPTGPKPMDLKSISMSSLSPPLGETFVFPKNNEGAMKKPLDDNFPFKPSPRDETRWTKSGGERKKEKENDEKEEEELARVPPPMFSTAKKKKKKREFRVFEAPPPKYAEEEEDEDEEEVIVLTATRKKTKRKTTSSSRFAIFDGGFRGFDEDDEGKTKKKRKKRKFDEDEEDEEGGEMKKEEKEETIRRAVPATLPFPTSATTTKKNEKIKQDDDGNKTAKRRRRCSGNSAAAADDTNNNTNNKNSNAEFEKKMELALEREKASGSGRDVMASKSGAIANSPPTAAAVLVPPPVVAGAAMVFDASKTATTDDVARMKKKPATKSYKNFASKKPPSNSSKGFPVFFDVAAAVAKKKAQIEAAKVQVGFGSSARKPAGIDPIPTKKPVVSASGSFRLGVSSSSASKRAKSTISGSVGSPFEVQQQQQQPVSEFQKMIQKARENLESSKAAEMLRSPAPSTTAAVAPSPAAVERSTQRSLKMSTPSSSFARAPNAGKHQRFTSPPSAAAAAAAAPKAKVAASSVEQQRKQQPRQQAMPPPAASVKFPVNQTLVFAATKSGNGAGVVDIVAKAKQKTYDPSTAEKAKKKAKEMYDKKLLDAERKEKLGQLSALDATLSSKAPSGVRDLVPRSFASSHDDATAAGENKKKTASSTSSRVFGGAMTKAQKAHMAMEWDPL